MTDFDHLIAGLILHPANFHCVAKCRKTAALYNYSLKEVKMLSSSKIWGTTSNERLLSYPCDSYIETFHDTYYRGVTIHADPEIIFQWICQMRVAPYSYDWIDNFGRKSPQKLIPGLDELETGQKIMFIFNLIDFKRNKHITIRFNKAGPKSFGDTVISYRIFSKGHAECRLIVKLIARYPKGFPGWLLSRILPLGDLIMMRRQLLNFKKLAERSQNSA